MRHASALVTAALLASCAHTAAQTTYRTPVQQHRATVRILVTCLRPQMGDVPAAIVPHYGSGTLVAPDRVLTAAHVATCVPGQTVLMTTVDPGGGGVQHTAHAEYIGLRNDVATLRLNFGRYDGFMTPVVLGARPLVGEIACESSAAPRWTYRCGVVQPTPADGPIMIDMLAEHGNSGSGVYNSRGELVGVLVARIPCEGDVYCLAGVEPLQHLPSLVGP